MADVELLVARRIGAREIPQWSAKALKFCKRVQCGVVIKVIVNGGFLVVVEGVVHSNLELIPPVSILWNSNYRAGISPNAWHALQQADRHRVEALRGNLVAWENRAPRLCRWYRQGRAADDALQ